MAGLTHYIGNADQFPILKKWHFFNHAGVSPLPRVAGDAMRLYASQAEADTYIGTGWYHGVEQLRQSAATLINAHRDEIAFVKNTSEGISIVAAGLDWRQGDVIVTTAVEYPANIYPWMEVARRHGARLVMVPEETTDDGGRVVSMERIIEAASDERCRMVAISHIEYASGQRHDLAHLGKFCRENHKLLCVDAIQSLGAVPLDVQAMNIDYLSADGHKWMLGPEGAGFFFCRRELIERTRPLSVGWMNVIDAQNYGNYDYTLKPDAGRFECGTYNIPGLLGFKASLDLLLSVGIESVAERLHHLGQRLIDGLKSKGYSVLSPRGPGQWSGIVSFTSPTHNHEQVVRMLRKEKQTEIAVREERLRVSPHFYNTDEQMDLLLENLPSH